MESGGFVGSMAFNRFIQEPPILSRSARRPQGARDKHQPAGGNSAESCVAEDDAHDKGVRGMVEAAKEAVLDVLRGPSVVGNVAMSLVPDVVDEQKDLSKMERSKNTVTATSDVSVVSCRSSPAGVQQLHSFPSSSCAGNRRRRKQTTPYSSTAPMPTFPLLALHCWVS